MLQKAVTVGNSIAVVIPKDFQRRTKIKAGTPLEVNLTSRGRIVIDVAKKLEPESIVDPRVLKAGEGLLKRYLPAFKKLAQCVND